MAMLELVVASAAIGLSAGLAVRVQRSQRFRNNEPVKWAAFVANFAVIALVASAVRGQVADGSSNMLLASAAVVVVVLLLVGFAGSRQDG
jgi:hypothetical protein